MSKIICIYHSRDLDGWMSAAIVKKWFNETYPKASSISNLNEDSHTVLPPDEISTGESLDFLGWDYGDTIPDLFDYDKIIMCDISFPKEEMFSLKMEFESNFIWIDHHKSAIEASKPNGDEDINGLRNTNFAACELTWKYFFFTEEMPEIVRLLGRYDCFGGKGTDEWQKILEFQYATRGLISNYEECYSVITMPFEHQDTFVVTTLEKGEAIYKYLYTEAKQTYSKAFPIEFIFSTTETIPTPEFGGSELYTTVIKCKFLCVNQERFNPVNFEINYHKEGYDGFACFWYKDSKWHWSLYNGNEEVDCSIIAKQFGGGGHKGAAGMVTNTETFLKIINQ